MADLDTGALLARAKAETGFSDWGDDSFEERLGLAVNHINSIPMDEAGRKAAAENINWLLTDRLKFFNDRKVYPLDQEVIERPMFATGEPRSGTTLMHALMSVDPDARAPGFAALWREKYSCEEAFAAKVALFAALKAGATGVYRGRIGNATAYLALMG